MNSLAGKKRSRGNSMFAIGFENRTGAHLRELVRHGVGRRRAGRCSAEKLLRFFSFVTHNQTVSRIENPCVGGSIPPLATIEFKGLDSLR